jgi:uncharacterized membrane protein
MKDPFNLVIALILTGLGASWIIYPEWAYRIVTPEQAARDRKRIKIAGYVMFPLGLILLAGYLFG